MCYDEYVAMPKIPVDHAQIDNTHVTDEEYKATSTAQRDLRAKLLARPAARIRYEQTLAEIGTHQTNLTQVRRARALAQAAIAELTGMNQSEVSKLEHRSDMFISTLRKFIEATGGELHLVASYQEGSVELQVPWGADRSDDAPLPIDIRESESA